MKIEIYSGFGAANLTFIRDFRDLFDNLNVVEYGISASFILNFKISRDLLNNFEITRDLLNFREYKISNSRFIEIKKSLIYSSINVDLPVNTDKWKP